MKVFISQPMKDKTDNEIKDERQAVLSTLRRRYTEPIEVIESFFEGGSHDATPLWYLGESIKLLGNADIAYFCKGWEKYRGCTIEHECAVRYGIKCIYAT